MAFDIEVKGLDEAIRKLDELARGLTPNEFIKWAEKVEQRAKQICNDPDCKRIKITPKPDKTVEFKVSDPEAMDCIIKAIQELLNSMPLTTRIYFDSMMNILKEDKEKRLKSK